MIDDVVDFWFSQDDFNRTSYMSLIFKMSNPEFYEVEDLREAFEPKQHPIIADHYPYNQLRKRFLELPKDDMVAFEIVEDEDNADIDSF